MFIMFALKLINQTPVSLTGVSFSSFFKMCIYPALCTVFSSFFACPIVFFCEKLDILDNVLYQH